MTSERVQLPMGVPPLNTFYMYLTRGCNLACRHCWIAPTFQPNGGTGGHLDFALFAQAIEEGIPLGLRSVKLTGGEPLLHPDFVRMVDLLREKALEWSIETNGTLLTQSLARYLKDRSTLSHIALSLDGANYETHDSFRGVKGSFEKTCLSIRYLVEAGYRPQVIMSLHVGNLDELEKLVQLAEKLGAGSVKINLIQPTGRGSKLIATAKTLDIHALFKTGKWIEHEVQKRFSIPILYDWPMVFHSLQRLLGSGGDSCGILGILGILPAGGLAMCGIGLEIPELCYGQVGKDRIADVWISGSALTNLRHSVPDGLEGICADCLFRKQCLGKCVAQNYGLSKQLTASHWFCETAYRAGLFPKSRLYAKKEPSHID